jgi:hypothetical protein
LADKINEKWINKMIAGHRGCPAAEERKQK